MQFISSVTARRLLHFGILLTLFCANSKVFALGPLDQYRAWHSRRTISATDLSSIKRYNLHNQIPIGNGNTKIVQYGRYNNIAVVFDQRIDPDFIAWLENARSQIKIEALHNTRLPVTSLQIRLVDYVEKTLPLKKGKSFPPFLGQMIKEKRASQDARKAALKILFLEFGIYEQQTANEFKALTASSLSSLFRPVEQPQRFISCLLSVARLAR